MVQAKIKFLAKNRPEFIQELRKKVDVYFEANKISKYGNFNLYIKSILMFMLYFTPYFLMITGVILSFESVLVCWVLIGLGKAGIGMGVMHDANHRSFSKNKNINRWMGKSLYLLGGFPINWQFQHNTMHHSFTNIDGYDEDIDPGAYLRLSPHKPLSKLHKYQHIYGWLLYGLMTLSWVTVKDFTQLNRYRKEKVKLNTGKNFFILFITLSLAKAIYFFAFLVIPILVLPYEWYWIIVFFMVMHFTSGLILTIIFQTAHVVPQTEFPLANTKGEMDNNWAIHQLMTTADFSPNKAVFSWFIGGLNYQIEHHLFPNISHIHYPKLSKIVIETAKKYNITYHVHISFLKAVTEHAKMLKKLGRRPVTT